ncbi:MAG TPA: hypothetical protein VJO13_10020, partial [Ktedonobacterales bacterium]|nr:hypothetical protein [Ktedonobacterales bacterium]
MSITIQEQEIIERRLRDIERQLADVRAQLPNLHALAAKLRELARGLGYPINSVEKTRKRLRELADLL